MLTSKKKSSVTQYYQNSSHIYSFIILVVDLTGSIMAERFKLYYDNWHLVISSLFATANVTRFFVCYMFFRSTYIFWSICMYMYYLYFVCFVYLPSGLWVGWSNPPPLFSGGGGVLDLWHLFKLLPTLFVDRQFPLILVF